LKIQAKVVMNSSTALTKNTF